MVLPCMVYGLEEAVFQQLLEKLTAVSKQLQTPLRIDLVTTDAGTMKRALEQTQGVSLIVVGMSAPEREALRTAVRLGHEAMANNRDHYIIYLVRDHAIMEAVSPLCVRPAGMMTFGALGRGGEILFRNIMADYRTIYQSQEKPADGWLYLKSQGTVNRVHMDDICQIQALNKKTEVHTLDQVITVYDTMDSMAAQLDERFLRCHRSYFINKEKIQYVDFANSLIRLMDGSSVPFARSSRKTVRDMVQQGDAAEAAAQ